jgi:hypothetical protein
LNLVFIGILFYFNRLLEEIASSTVKGLKSDRIVKSRLLFYNESKDKMKVSFMGGKTLF